MIKKFLKSVDLSLFDLYGTGPDIPLQGQRKSYSAVGIFSSLLVAGFVIWAVYINASELFTRQKPALTTANLPASTYNQEIKLTPEIFDFTFGLADVNSGLFYTDPSIYSVMVNIVPNVTNIYDVVPIQVEECTPSYTDGVSQYTGPTWCIKEDQLYTSDVAVKTKGQQYLSIIYLRCDNSSSPVPCAPPDEITQRLNNSVMVRLYSDYRINPFNYHQPLERYYRSDWTMPTLTQTKLTFLYLTTTEFSSDSGWITDSPQTQSVVTVDSFQTDSTDTWGPEMFSMLYIANTGNKAVYFT